MVTKPNCIGLDNYMHVIAVKRYICFRRVNSLYSIFQVTQFVIEMMQICGRCPLYIMVKLDKLGYLSSF